MPPRLTAWHCEHCHAVLGWVDEHGTCAILLAHVRCVEQGVGFICPVCGQVNVWQMRATVDKSGEVCYNNGNINQ